MGSEAPPALAAQERYDEALARLDELDHDDEGVDQWIARIERQQQGPWPQPLNLRELADREPDPPRMVIDDWLPVGYATLLAGHGGAGKSYIALYLAVCIALGERFFGLPTEQRRVLYLSCEDRQDVLHWRLSRICRHLGVGMDQLAGYLDVLDLVGQNTTMWERTGNGGGITGPFNLLTGMVQSRGAEVVFVDGVADTFGGNENDRGDVKRYVNALVGLIPADRGALVLVHHVNKPAAGTATSEGYSGSTGWHNSVRARWYLHPEIEQTEEGVDRTGRLMLELQKSNLGRADQQMTFEWDEEAHLFVGQVSAGTSAVERHMRYETELDGIVAAIAEIEAQGDYVPAAANGPRTAHHVLLAAESFPQTLKSKRDRRRFWRHIETLRRNGTVRESSIRRSNRHITATLTLKAAPDQACADAPNTAPEIATQTGAGAQCADAPNRHGGYRGCARTHCTHCDGEGCEWCEP
ncbi:AAA family ATPase [Thioalkalivibrio sp.]|uniref:AAA family ATPase n=1 Tax=Thioalkalivibrio sp. TaxID=2093813 RepID=UPI0035660D6C